MAVRRLDEAFQRAQDLPEQDQEAIAEELLEMLADLEAYRRAKAEGGEPLPLDQVLRSIEDMDE